MIDKDELHRLWNGSTLTVRDLAIYFHTTPGSVAGTIRRYRRREGADRWPTRAFSLPKGSGKPRPPERAGKTTLPPLRSLEQ